MYKSLIIKCLIYLSLSGSAQKPLESSLGKDSGHSVQIKVVDAQYGLWNDVGKSILPPVYDNIWFDPENRVFYIFKTVCCGLVTLVGFADENGQLIQEPTFKNMTAFYSDQACVETDSGLAVINKLGKWIVSPKDSMDPIHLNDSFSNQLFDQTLRDASWRDSLKALSLENQWILKKRLIPLVAFYSFLSPQPLEEPFPISLHLRGARRRESLRTQLKLQKLLVEADFINLRIQTYYPIEGIPLRSHYTVTFQRLKGDWKQIQLDDYLGIDAGKVNDFKRLILTKLAPMMDSQDLPVNLNDFLTQLQGQCFVQEKGMTFFSRNSSDWQLQCSWAELFPFVRKNKY
jgi:hypothetical protein